MKCDGGQPCQRCWQDGLSCAYNQARLFRAKEWTPQDAGLPSVPTAGLATAKVSKVSFVSENRRVESRYEIVDSARAPGPATKRTKTPGSSSFWENGPSAQHDESKLEDIPLRPPITDPTEAFFMERYCNIIGPWFDMFNTHGHWSHMVPHLALSNKALFRSIVASCAKQYGLVAGESSIFALDYYNLALKELTQALGDDGLTSTAAVFASCLLTGYCEMIDAKSLDWQTHLRGTFSLCSTQGWHGQCGGVAQSCFWVYCRMDLLASLARAERTRLDTSSWLPKDGSLGPSDEQRGWEPDSWCNQIVLLLAQTHNLLCDVRQSSCSPVDQPYLLRRWNAVSMALSNHEAARPPWFRPVIQLPPTGAANPFERITYVSAAACAATQMLDLTSLLLIVAFPDKSPAQQRERLTSYAVTELALSLSRKIAGNSITNRLTIAWANAVQLLSSAGLVLVADNERAAVVKILQDIKKETGWSVEGHVDRLSEWWRASDGHFRGNYWQYKGSPGNDMMLRQIGESLTSIAGKFEAY